MALRRETREQWGAKPPKNRRYVTASTAKTGGVAVHYPGSEGSMAHLTHSQCQATMRGWQTYHMGRGSNDLEYGSVICQHGRWMEARTEFDNWLVRVGSNGTAAANDRHTSVQLMLGTTDRITDEQKAWLAEAIATLRAHGWGLDVKGHRDFVGTPCPGSSIYNALPEIRRMADTWNGDDDVTEADIEAIVERVAARVNRVLGDYNAKGEPAGPNKDDPQTGATYLRRILKRVAG